jgi:hypothetical protein
MDSVVKNNLTVEIRDEKGVYSLAVLNATGTVLRVLHSADVLRLLEFGVDDSSQSQNGRILDRRI